MKKFSFALMLVLSFALIGGAQAQKKAMDSKKPGASKMAAKASNSSISGIVKGAANGKMFTVAQKKGPVSVDGTGVQPRNKAGQFAKWTDIKGGTMVTVVGKMTGTTMKASKITINFVAGGKKPVAPAVKPVAGAKAEKKKGMMGKMKDKMGAMKDKMKSKMGGGDAKKP
ncbi:MAG: hypothetical protein ABJA67_13120 [Chthonomonadales bacterium]